MEVKYSLEEIGHNTMFTYLESDALIKKHKAIYAQTQNDILEILHEMEKLENRL